MFSDAGGALARRRRDILGSSLSLCNLPQTFRYFVSLFCCPSLLWRTILVKEEIYLPTCSPLMKSENSLLYITRSKNSRTFAILVVLCLYRIPLKSNMPSLCPLTEWSSALTVEPVMTLTAEGSDPTLPSLSSIAYVHGGAPQASPTRAKLGFRLLGLPLYYGPPKMSQPTGENINLPTKFTRPRFIYFNLSLSPIISLLCPHGLIRRRPKSFCEATNSIWCCEYSPQTLVLSFPRAIVVKTLIRKTIDGSMSLKFLPFEHLVSLGVNQICLFRCIRSSTFLPVIIFIDCPQKQLEIDSIQRPHAEVVSPLFLRLSRTLAFEASNLNELGIMIQSRRNCGYRCVFMLPSPTRLIHKPVKLPLINFLKFPPKNLKTSGIMIPIQCSGDYHNIFKPSRTMVNHIRKTSRMKSRIALLLDLKGPRRPSSSVVERTSAPPSSFVERNRSDLLVAPLGLASAIHEAKNPFQTPKNLLIVAIYKIPETFVEVSLTHHSLACGMLLVNLCFRDSMDLSSKLDVYLIYLMYVVSMCFKTLYPMYPLFGLIE